MKKDFHIDWDMPASHLCPGIPGRINYLSWLHDVLHLLPKYAQAKDPLLGIDVGTGASCIYPLLGNALYHWEFIATDIDPESIASAESLVREPPGICNSRSSERAESASSERSRGVL